MVYDIVYRFFLIFFILYLMYSKTMSILESIFASVIHKKKIDATSFANTRELSNTTNFLILGL